jgi:hypothetical protein
MKAASYFPTVISRRTIFPALGFTFLAAGIQMASAAPSTSYNTGTLGTAGDGANSTGVVIDQPGAISTYPDYSSTYASPDNTTVPFRPELNPIASSPFTIEFWAKPTASDNDDAPVSNRLGGSVNRTGWVFFQRAAGTGWNFRMYNGNGTALGWDLTGGTSTLNVWSHVVAVWNGSSAQLYVNGANTNAPNNGAGGYNVNVTESFYLGALIGGGSPSTGSVDEVAFYPTALSATQISNHYAAATNPALGKYSSLVLADGAIEYLQQNPPSATLTVTSTSPLITPVTFTGILSQSPDLVTWTDLVVTSPYTPPSPQPDKLFFRAHR